MEASPWWEPERHRERRPRLLARNRIKADLRARFESQGFVEVEAAQLQTSPGNEAHLHAFSTDLRATDGTPLATLYLHTSPEFAAKKLLAAGERRIFEFARVFRNRERGALHSPEFTMLEWYRAGEGYEALMKDCAEIVGEAAESAGCDRFVFRGRTVDPRAGFERLSVAEAFERHAGIDLAAGLSAEGTTDRDRLAGDAAAAGIRVAPDDSWADIFSRVLVERVEPAIGNGRVTILDRYPVSEAALARPCADDPRFAERFELYACGVELANAFGELTDADEQRRRFEDEMAVKRAVYGESYPIDEDFIAALGVMPAAAGAALGFDRLAMLATGAQNVEAVMWTPAAKR